MSGTLNRRRFVEAGLGATVAASLPGASFAQSTPDASPAASPDAAMATPVGTVGADGHYPSGNPAVPDAWTKYPKPFKSTDGVPGNGGEVKALVLTYVAPPVEKSKNQYWQELEKRLGVTWTPTLAPSANYGEKATTLIASGDMPDLFYINTVITASPLRKFVVEGAFLDISEYTTPEALKEYPNLAAIPQFMWDAAKTDGKQYGIPCPTPKAPQLPAWRTDWSKKILGRDPQNAQEVHDVLVGMTKDDPDGDGKDNTWGGNKYGTYWSNGLLSNMFGVPNGWAVDDAGKFTAAHETEGYKEYLQFTRKLVEDGAYHPDVSSWEWDKASEMFSSGQVGFFTDGSAIYGKGQLLDRIRKIQPDAEVNRLIPPGKDGGKGVTYNGTGIFGYTCFPADLQDKERIAELLRILNYFSAPFGSEEYTFLNSGLEGIHHTVDENGFPIRTDLMEKEWGQLTAYLGGAMPVNTTPDQPEIAPLITDEQAAAFAIGLDNPAATLYSPAAAEATTLGQSLDDTVNDYILGRVELEEVEKEIEAWRMDGGDEIRKEYEEAYAKSKG